MAIRRCFSTLPRLSLRSSSFSSSRSRIRQNLLQLQWKPLSTTATLANEPSRGVPYTTVLDEARCSHQSTTIPTYRILDMEGQVINPQEDPELSDSMLLQMYEKMVTQIVMDEQLYKAQRMGLVSFYMMNVGEEASQYGSSAALDPEDMLYLQYREVGVLLWRGFTVEQCMNQCFSNRLDLSKGRQMPVHYGSKDLNVQFISSCLSTQMPHAPGYAYGLKLSGAKTCVCVYFGDGAAQEGDAHAAMNFAATLKCPVIFFCRNNGYAISTPSNENYAGDGIASRGSGYGMESYRVDGNDVLAVYKVTKHARDTVVQEQRPILIEAMSYRIGSHSTSDDQTGYQDMDEVSHWKEFNNPLTRLRGYMNHRGLWTQELEDQLKSNAEKEVKTSLQRARVELKPKVDELFNDVYDKLPQRLQRQRKEMWDVVNRYKEHYPLDEYEES